MSLLLKSLLYRIARSMLYASDPLVGVVVVGMRLLELLAIAFLTSVTVQ